MAEKLEQIRRRIRSVESTEKITNAMKLVSNARLRQATNRFQFVRGNLTGVAEDFSDIILAGKASGECEDLFSGREGRKLYVIFSSSKGLCGNFNSVICKAADGIAAEQEDDVLFIPAGLKIKDYLDSRGITYEDCGRGDLDGFTYGDAELLSERILDGYRNGEFSRAGLIYVKYINAISSDPRTEELLPFSERKMRGLSGDKKPVEIETGSEKERVEFLRYSVIQYLSLIIYEKACETLVCEHSARRTAMNNASDNAREMIERLSVRYNRARQAAITNEIIEIISGSEAQRK